MPKKYFSAVLGILTVILEALPFGAVINMIQAPDEPVRSIAYYYSYFDLTPFGYANFGPFLTAVLTSIIAVMTIIGLFIKSRRLVIARTVLCAVAFLTSLMPLMFGMSYFTVTGLCISLLILVNGVATYCFESKN